MHRAVDQLKIRPQHLLIDGNRFKKYQDLLHTTVVKGDGKYLFYCRCIYSGENLSVMII